MSEYAGAVALSENVPHIDNPSCAVHVWTRRAAFENLVSVAKLKLPSVSTITALRASESFPVLLPFLPLKARRSVYHGVLPGQ